MPLACEVHRKGREGKDKNGHKSRKGPKMSNEEWKQSEKNTC